MAEFITIAMRLQAEAARCERVALGVSNPDLISRLLAWAREYRRDAREAYPR